MNNDEKHKLFKQAVAKFDPSDKAALDDMLVIFSDIKRTATNDQLLLINVIEWNIKELLKQI